MKPLSKKQRLSSLGFLLLIFILAVPVLLAYSSGYRFDFESMNFEKTGGVFIHSDLSGANVFIDEEYSESGGVFLKNILIQNLKANSVYKIRVEKEGYLPWYKDLFVYPNLVTEASVMMMPILIEFEKIKQFIVVLNDTEINSTPISASASTSTEQVTKEYEDVLKMFTSTTTVNIHDIVFETEIVKSTSTTATSTVEKIIPQYLQDLKIEGIEDKEQLKQNNKMIAWLEDGNIYVVWSGDYESTPFFFCDPRGCRDKIIVSLDADIESFDFFPGRNDIFVISTQNHIFAVEADDRSTQNLQVIFEGENPDFKLSGDTIFIKDGQDLYRAEI